MRHRKKNRKLGRTTSHRKMLFRNQMTALFEHGQIRTTLHKCKELRPIAEKVITVAKGGDLHARRQIARLLIGERLRENNGSGKHLVLQKLFDELAEQYQDRNGGYTRIIKAEQRKGDGAKMAYIQLV